MCFKGKSSRTGEFIEHLTPHILEKRMWKESSELLLCVSEHDLCLFCSCTLHNGHYGGHTKSTGQMEQSKADDAPLRCVFHHYRSLTIHLCNYKLSANSSQRNMIFEWSLIKRYTKQTDFIGRSYLCLCIARLHHFVWISLFLHPQSVLGKFDWSRVRKILFKFW